MLSQLLLMAAMAVSTAEAGPFEVELAPNASGGATVTIHIPPGHAVYASRTEVLIDGAPVSPVTPVIVQQDPILGSERLWRQQARWDIPNWTPATVARVKVQGCNEDEGICFPPAKVELASR